MHSTWYKLAQQQVQNLLFYPWKERYTSEVSEKAHPDYVDNTGKKYYRCSVCNTMLSEDEADYWYSSYDFNPHIYSLPNFDSNKLRSDAEKLLSLLRTKYLPAYEKASEEYLADQAKQGRNRDSIPRSGFIMYYSVDAPDVISIIHNSDLLNAITAISSIFYAMDIRLVDMIKSILEKNKVTGYALETLRQTDYGDAIAQLNRTLAEYKKRRTAKVPIVKTICNDCLESYPECSECGKKIVSPRDRIEVHDGPLICRKCLDDSNKYQVCDRCSDVFHKEEMKGDIDESYCQGCFEYLDDIDNWTEAIADWAGEKDYLFNKWFNPESPDRIGNTRIYIPYFDTKEMDDNDKYVVDFLENRTVYHRDQSGQLKAEKCHMTPQEYQKGQCRLGNRKNPIGISNVLDRVARYEPENEMWIQKLKKFFATSGFRKLKDTSKLSVVISQDPIDIATMSTGRNWYSCMHLGVGSQKDVVPEEVAEGGLIAYLIRDDDKEIEDPIARLLIRRYESDKGQSVLMPSEHVYGNAGEEFRDFVLKWLEEKQGRKVPNSQDPKAKQYELRGMGYIERNEPFTIWAKRNLTKIMIKQAKT